MPQTPADLPLPDIIWSLLTVIHNAVGIETALANVGKAEATVRLIMPAPQAPKFLPRKHQRKPFLIPRSIRYSNRETISGQFFRRALHLA